LSSKRVLGLILVVAVVAVLATGCGGSGSSSAETTSTTETTEVTEATVASFDVGDLDCGSGEAEGSVEVSWETEAATAVELAVDGEPPGASAGYGPEGTADLAIPCDGESHEVSVTALNDSGAGETVTEQVEPG
jgi:hypothetical protein